MDQSSPSHSNTSLQQELKTILFINWMGELQCGFGEDQIARFKFPPVYGKSKYLCLLDPGPGYDPTRYYIGEEALLNESMLFLEYPLNNNKNNNTNFEQIAHFIGEILSQKFKYEVIPNEARIMFTYNINIPTEYQDNIIKMMYDKLGFRGCSVVQEHLLTLCASGRNTGLVMHIDENITSIVGFQERIFLPQSLIQLNLGSNDIANYLGKLFNCSKFEMAKMIPNLIETCCEFILEIPPNQPEPIHYMRPDGEEIFICAERWKATEVLLNPGIVNKSVPSIIQAIDSSINAIPASLQNVMITNIIISGKIALLRGFQARIERDLKFKDPKFASVHIDILQNSSEKIFKTAASMAMDPKYAAIWHYKPYELIPNDSIEHPKTDIVTSLRESILEFQSDLKKRMDVKPSINVEQTPMDPNSEKTRLAREEFLKELKKLKKILE